MIGDSTVFIDPDHDTIKGTVFRGTDGLWEILKRKNVNKHLTVKEDLNSYKQILIMTNAHLNSYQPGDNNNILRGKKFRDVITPLFAKGQGDESSLWRSWQKY